MKKYKWVEKWIAQNRKKAANSDDLNEKSILNEIADRLEIKLESKCNEK